MSGIERRDCAVPYYRDTYPLIEVADLGPGVRRLLYQARNGTTDAQVRHAIETIEAQYSA